MKAVVKYDRLGKYAFILCLMSRPLECGNYYKTKPHHFELTSYL